MGTSIALTLTYGKKTFLNIFKYESKTQGNTWLHTVIQRLLHIQTVDIAAMLESDVRQEADGNEPELGVELERARVVLCRPTHSNHLLKTILFQSLQQVCIQLRACALSYTRTVHVYTRLAALAIGWSLPKLTCICIAYYRTIIFCN